MAITPKASGPPTAPLFDESGVMAKVWQWYLYQVFTSAQQATDIEVLQTFDSAADSGAIAASEDAQRLALIADAPAVQPTDIEDLRRRLVVLNENAADPRPADDLSKLLFALMGDAPPRVVLTGTAALRALTPAADGAVFFETDTQFLWIAVAGVWIQVTASGSAPGAWTAYNANPAVGGGATATFTNKVAAWQQDGKRIYFRAFSTINISAGATNDFLFDFPAAALTPFPGGGTGQVMACSAHRNALGITEFCAAVQISATQIAVRAAANYTGAVDYNVSIEGVFEAA
jgi:hypothetical protein